MPMPDLAPLAVVVLALLAALAVWRHYRRRDGLMALANATRPRCTHIGRASELNHLWHECDLHPRHADVDPMHHCACGAYWRRAPHETSQIQALDALYADATEPDRRH
jgi:MYXO-CTERM domain-containing protein